MILQTLERKPHFSYVAKKESFFKLRNGKINAFPKVGIKGMSFFFPAKMVRPTLPPLEEKKNETEKQFITFG